MMKRRIACVGVALVLVWLACSFAVAAAQTPKRAPQLVIAQLRNPTALDGWNWAATSEQDMLAHIQETLVEYDREAKLHPLPAERAEMQTPAEWLITIRRGVKFHDLDLGELTAEDVKASIEANLRQGTAMSLRVPSAMREGALEVVDAYTLKWKLKEPELVTLAQWLVDEYITSKKYLEREGYDGAARRPVGSGPYRFVEWLPNQRVVMEVFKDYWRPLPRFDRLVWRIIPDASTRKNEFLTGGIDVLPFVTPEIVPEIRANSNPRLETVLSTWMMFILLPVANPLLADKRVRLALNYGVNKREIINQLFRGIGAAELTAPVPFTVTERNPKLEGYPYDPAKAQQLLKEAGAVGKTLTLEAPQNRYTLDREMGEAIAGSWEAVGLRVEYKPQEFAVFAPKVLRGSPAWPTNPFLVGFGDGRTWPMKFTLILAGLTIVVSGLLALPLGIIAALKRGSVLDVGIRVVAVMGQSMPSFWVAMLLMLVLAVQLRLFPVSGLGVRNSILPTITLAFFQMAVLLRLVRSEMLEVMSQEYIRTARAKGLPELRVTVQHALKNAAIPVITMMGLQFGALAQGAIVVEPIFAWPGLGWLLVESITARDFPVVVAGAIIAAIFVTMVNLPVDIVYGWLDPRIGVNGGDELSRHAA